MADKRKQIVLKEILGLIDSIKDHADDLEWNNHIPQIELEFISSKIAKLYEKSIILNFLNTFEDEYVSAKSQTVMQHLHLQEAIKKEVLANTIQPAQETEPVLENNSTASIPESVHVNEVIEEVINEQPVTITHEVKETFSPVETSTIDQTIKSTEHIIEETITVSVNETKAEASTPAPTSTLNKIIDPKRPPISNLKTAISINQRLQYINNLFKGNAELLNQTIDELNNLSSLQEASQKLEEITAKMGWDKEYELYQGFKELVERRYS